MVIAIVIMGCSRDNKDSVITLNQLSQTIWDGCVTSYDSDDNPSDIKTFVLEFISDTEGKYVEPGNYPIERFQYLLNKSILSFKGKYPISGDWYITKSSKNQITLLSYSSLKTIMTLERIY